MFADPERQAAAPGQTDDMRPLDLGGVQHRDDIGHPNRHRICVGVVRLAARAVPAVIDEHEAQVLGRQRPNERRAPNQFDRIEEASEDDDGSACASIVLVEDGLAVDRVGREGHRPTDATRRRCPRYEGMRPAVRRTESKRSTGSAKSVFPSRPTVVCAASIAFRTASSVASIVALKTDEMICQDSFPSASTVGVYGRPSSGTAFAVENAMNCSPLPFDA
jgi:hypothetical protein